MQPKDVETKVTLVNIKRDKTTFSHLSHFPPLENWVEQDRFNPEYVEGGDLPLDQCISKGWSSTLSEILCYSSYF